MRASVLGVIVLLTVLDYARSQALEEDTQVDYAGDYAGNDVDNDKPKDEDVPALSEESEEKSEKHKHSKRHKYWKATLEFLKKNFNPNTLMQNAWFTEMLRKFSHSEDAPEEHYDSEHSEEVHTVVPTKRRRGRPKKRLHDISEEVAGLTGILKKGFKKLSTIDKRKLNRKVRMMKRIARKAKRPLKSVVKFYLSSKNNGNNMYGNTGYGNNY